MTTPDQEKVIEEDLTEESSRSEEEVRRESEDISKEAMDKTFSAEASSVEEANRQIADAVKDIGREVLGDIQMDVIDSTRSRKGARRDRSAAGNRSVEEVDKLEADADEYKEDVGAEPSKGRLFTRLKGISFLLALGSLAMSVGQMVATIAKFYIPSPEANSDDPPLDPKLEALLKERVERWRALPEAEMWAAVARYCDGYNPPWPAQMLILDTIHRLAAPLPDGWMWRGGDEADFVYRLRDAFGSYFPGNEHVRSRIIYDTLATFEYDGRNDGKKAPLPRAAAAHIAEMAVAAIARELKEGK